MRSILKGRRISPAMIVACVALSLALAGTSIAATVSALTGGEKRQVKKIAKKQANKRIAALAPGLSVGFASTAGVANSVANISIRSVVDVPNPSPSQDYAEVDCPAGTVLTGGGAFGSSGTAFDGQHINSSWPVDANTWGVYMNNEAASDANTFNVYAICTAAAATG